MIYILDTETSGVSKQDQVIELAYLKVSNTTKLDVEQEFVERFNPDVPINPRAFEVHGIDKRSLLRDKCKPSTSLTIPSDMKYMIAHNASFDTRLLRQTMDFELHSQLDELVVICSIKLIKSLEKIQGGKFGFIDYKLVTIFKHFYPEYQDWQEANIHTALGDCRILRMVLTKCLQCFPHIKDLESLFKLAKLT